MLPNFLTHLFPQRKNEKRILILGLDCAGKTTFLYRMHLGEIVTTIPTIGLNVETVKAPTYGRRDPLNLTCWDVGGCDKLRPLIRHYTAGTDALIWILDSNDRERLPEANEELRIMLDVIESERERDTNPTPCLILANKQDLQDAMSLDEVRIRMAPIISARASCAIFTTSMVSNNFLPTITPAMDWLYDNLSVEEPKKYNPQSLSPRALVVEGLAEKLNSWVERAFKDVPPAEFLEAFNAISLPSWDHYTHIRIAYTYTLMVDKKVRIGKTYKGSGLTRPSGKTMIFDGIEKYIKTSAQTTGRTFHITMTYFWIQIVHFGIQSMPTEDIQTNYGVNENFCRFLLLNPYVADGNLWVDYYSKDVIMTPNAKVNMILPDKQPLPNLVARDSIRK
ncbi:ADP-ribosylation factor [Rhizoctonia solani]|nr:ADP-ribosylation factor [Rhizoctonia solani]